MKTIGPQLARTFVVALFAVLAQGNAVAYETMTTVDLNVSPFYLYPNQDQWINLNGWHSVKKIILRGFGAGADAMFDVYVNGDLKGSVHLPARDPEYTVTVDETAQWILLRHRWGGVAQINQVFAVESERCLPATERISTMVNTSPLPELPPRDLASRIRFPAHNRASELARDAVEVIERLQGYASYKEFGEYLLPIKKAALRAYAAAEGHGALSGGVRWHLQALQKQIEFASGYIDETFEREEALTLAVNLKRIAEELEAELH